MINMNMYQKRKMRQENNNKKEVNNKDNINWCKSNYGKLHMKAYR